MNRAVVCVVGRPNVGKSTLFNRITKSRIAITEDTPGVTRDRIYAEGEWLGKYFTIIDTGGLDPESEELITKNIKMQAELAMDMADVIIFVVDGVVGLTPADEEIANLLRLSGKEIVIAANKMDTKGFDEGIYEFYELGLGDIVPISAEQSMGIGDLLDKVVNHFPKDVDTEYDRDIIKVSLIGKPNVGKSSLINRILGEDRVIVTNIPGTTRDAIDTFYEHNGNRYILIDTAGLRKKGRIYENVERYSVVRTLSAIDRSDISVLVIDATEGVTEQDTKIAGYAHDNGKALIVAVNKWDLIEKDNNTVKEFESDIRRMLGFINYAPIIFISAETGQRVDKLFETINVVSNNYNLRISTGVLNDIINEAVLMNQPPSDKGVRLKIYYGTQVSVGPPRFLIFINDRELMHFSYQRYLENQIRQYFGFQGVPLKFEFRERGE